MKITMRYGREVSDDAHDKSKAALEAAVARGWASDSGDNVVWATQQIDDVQVTFTKDHDSYQIWLCAADDCESQTYLQRFRYRGRMVLEVPL